MVDLRAMASRPELMGCTSWRHCLKTLHGTMVLQENKFDHKTNLWDKRLHKIGSSKYDSRFYDNNNNKKKKKVIYGHLDVISPMTGTWVNKAMRNKRLVCNIISTKCPITILHTVWSDFTLIRTSICLAANYGQIIQPHFNVNISLIYNMCKAQISNTHAGSPHRKWKLECAIECNISIILQ